MCVVRPVSVLSLVVVLVVWCNGLRFLTSALRRVLSSVCLCTRVCLWVDSIPLLKDPSLLSTQCLVLPMAR